MWIELHQSLPTHRKILRLKRELKIKKPTAIGHMVLLWLWALDNAIDGDLTDFSAEDIAEVAEWTGKADAFTEALVSAGFLDCDDNNGLYIHNWGKYTSRIADFKAMQSRPTRTAEEKREQTRKRVQAFRDRQKADDCNACNADSALHGNAVNALQDEQNVTPVTHGNADTYTIPIPYHTIPVPNPTLPSDDKERNQRKKESGGEAEAAEAEKTGVDWVRLALSAYKFKFRDSEGKPQYLHYAKKAFEEQHVRINFETGEVTTVDGDIPHSVSAD